MVEQLSTPLDLGILLGLGYQSFVDELRADLARRGFADLGKAYGYVFRALGAGALNLRQLARQLDMTDQGAAKIIDEMAARGYVERRPDPADGRSKTLVLARRGRAALAAARRFHAAYERRLIRRSSAADVATLRRILSLIAHSPDEARLRAL